MLPGLTYPTSHALQFANNFGQTNLFLTLALSLSDYFFRTLYLTSNMPFVSEDFIDTVAEDLAARDEGYQQAITDFQQRQPELMAFIISEDTIFLTSQERDHFLYLSLIIWESVSRQSPELPIIGRDKIAKAEDKNWEKLEGVKTRSFRERLDIFFEGYPQEDLLAFVEDALVPDDDSPITKEGREPLFVALKTIIDVIAV